MKTNSPADKFASIAREFCDWAESPDEGASTDVKEAIQYLSVLYQSALLLDDESDESQECGLTVSDQVTLPRFYVHQI